jgi:uncharacterized protein (DUF169 family)
MYWRQWSEKLVRGLGLGRQPIAVSFTGGPTPGVAQQGKLSVCQAIVRAAGGESFTISAETCGCPGGLVSLGLGQMPAAGRERLVDFLVNKEKVYCSRVAIHRSQQGAPAPVGMASHVSFTPLSQAPVLPDLVGFLDQPTKLHYLIGLAAYWDGCSVKAELAGPACRTGIAYPVVTGEIGLSLLDFGARRMAGFSDSDLLVTVPFHRMIGIIQALDQGIGWHQKEDIEEIEKQIDDLGKIERS